MAAARRFQEAGIKHSVGIHLGALHSQGYTVMEGVLTAREISEARSALETVFRREQKFGPRRGWHNDIYKVAYLLPQKHPLFRTFCQRPALLALMRRALGDDCVVASLNGLTMTPGGRAQPLHIDQDQTVPGTALYINALHTLDDFTRDNGCTRVVPGSHERPWTGDARGIEAAEAHAVHVEAPAGSVIAYSGGLWHGGGRNATDRERYAVHAFFARSWVRPQWDFSASLSRRVIASLAPEQRRLFGFTARPRRYDPVSHSTFRGDVCDRPSWLRSLLRRLARR